MPKIDAFQQFLLFHFAEAGRLTVDQIVKRTLPPRAPPLTRRTWSTEVELACELLALRHLVSVDRNARDKAYVASARVLHLLPAPLRNMMLARLATPVAAAMMLNACAAFPGASAGRTTSYWGDDARRPPPVVRNYHEEVTAPPIVSRIEQFPRESGNGVYRMCDSDCPQPTPKRMARLPAAATVAAIPAAPPAPTAAADAPAPRSGDASKIVNMNEVMQKGLADALNATFGGGRKSAAANEAKNAEAVAIAPASVADKPHKKRPKPAAKPAESATDTESVTPAAVESAAGNVEPPVAQSIIEPVKPVAPVKRRYVDPKNDPNADATPEERAKIQRMMEEARDASTGKAPPAPAAKPGTGAIADPGMTPSVTVTRIQAPERATAMHVALADPKGGLPAPAPVPASSDIGDAVPDPRELLSAWANAWSNRDTDRYFALYAKDFVPYHLPSRADFVARRGSAISTARSIEIKVEPVAVIVRGERATIRFWQVYQSPRFKSRIQKALELVRDGDGWKIHRERLVHYAAPAADKGVS